MQYIQAFYILACVCDLVFESLHAMSVLFKREKSANLRKHVRRIRSYNSKMRKKVQRYLLIFSQLLKSLEPTVSREKQ